MKTINRGALLKQARQGKLVMIESYRNDEIHGTSMTTKELPVQVIENSEQWKEGFCNLREQDFRTKSGCAYETANGDVVLFVHSNFNVTLRKKN